MNTASHLPIAEQICDAIYDGLLNLGVKCIFDIIPTPTISDKASNVCGLIGQSSGFHNYARFYHVCCGYI